MSGRRRRILTAVSCLILGSALTLLIENHFGHRLGPAAPRAHSSGDPANGDAAEGHPGVAARKTRWLAEDSLQHRDQMQFLSNRVASLERRNRDLEHQMADYRSQSANHAQQLGALETPLNWLQQISNDRFGDLTGDELFHLRQLDLSSLAVTDQDLAHLRNLPSLKSLNLRGTQITDSGLAALQSIPALTQLELRQTKITDAGIEHIRKIPNLRHLDLNTTQVTDAGVAQLQGLNQLEFLRLNSTQITDAGLAYLSTLPNLQRLDLWGNRLSEQGLNQIWNLPSLNHLEYGATSISLEWTEKFQEAHPHVYVVAPDYQSKIAQTKR